MKKTTNKKHSKNQDHEREWARRLEKPEKGHVHALKMLAQRSDQYREK